VEFKLPNAKFNEKLLSNYKLFQVSKQEGASQARRRAEVGVLFFSSFFFPQLL
jgi:hypothetical protein